MNQATNPPTNLTTFHCLDFRREKLADPKRLSPTAEAHVSTCVMCQAFARRVDSFEAQVAETLSVPIPEGLAERVILRTHSGHKSRWHLYALAASVLLAITVTVQLVSNPFGPKDTSAVMVAVEHVLHEPESFTTLRSADALEFKTVLASFGGQLEAPLGTIRYIRLCPIANHGVGWHIVYETQQGMVTLLLVPSKDKSQQTEMLTVEGMSVKVQRAGDGFYALIANTMPVLKAADEMMQKNVRWKT